VINNSEILQTIEMIDQQHLDIRTVTMGISLRDCAREDPQACCDRIYYKITRQAEKLVQTGEEIEKEFGIPIVNKRIAVTPIAMVAESSDTEDYTMFAETLDRAAPEEEKEEGGMPPLVVIILIIVILYSIFRSGFFGLITPRRRTWGFGPGSGYRGGGYTRGAGGFRSCGGGWSGGGRTSGGSRGGGFSSGGHSGGGGRSGGGGAGRR
jgi:hypothetical protein